MTKISGYFKAKIYYEENDLGAINLPFVGFVGFQKIKFGLGILSIYKSNIALFELDVCKDFNTIIL